VVGAVCRDTLTGEETPVYARVVINATGPFVDSVRKLSDAKAPDVITPSSGSHITLPSYYAPADVGMIIPKTKVRPPACRLSPRPPAGLSVRLCLAAGLRAVCHVRRSARLFPRRRASAGCWPCGGSPGLPPAGCTATTHHCRGFTSRDVRPNNSQSGR
jgi:hypothetical protein